MGAALRALYRALNEVRLNGYAYIWANVAFCVLCLPVVTAPAAFAALCRVSHEISIRPWEADLALFWESFRENLWRAMPWGLAHAVFLVVNITNLSTYAGRPEPIWVLLRVLWWSASFMWWGVFQYTWFIYAEMEQPSLWGASRNALVMVLSNPFFTLTICAAQMIVFVLSILMPPTFALLTFGVTVAISSAAVQNRLADYRQTRTDT